jgi:hypothetical protein
MLQSGLPDDVSVSVRTLLNVKPGCLGVGSEATSVAPVTSMGGHLDFLVRTGVPLMHLSTSSELNELFIVSSASSKHFPSFHKLHACRQKCFLYFLEVELRNATCVQYMR